MTMLLDAIRAEIEPLEARLGKLREIETLARLLDEDHEQGRGGVRDAR